MSFPSIQIDLWRGDGTVGCDIVNDRRLRAPLKARTDSSAETSGIGFGDPVRAGRGWFQIEKAAIAKHRQSLERNSSRRDPRKEMLTALARSATARNVSQVGGEHVCEDAEVMGTLRSQMRAG